MSTQVKSCCGPTCCSDTTSETVNAVREKYAETAKSTLTNASAGVQAVAEAFGYTAAELTSIPAEANMGLSCGNPVATAHLKPGEVVVDLGSGGGLDVFLAAQKVGPAGRAIGIDMTTEMVDRAQRAAAVGVGGKPFTNVEFHLSTIDKLPLADASVDVILSNCVINLAPDKQAVFREMFRVLKPGGRVAVSDIALKKPLPDDIRQDVMAYVGCIAGAVMVDEYEQGLRDAGFGGVAVVDSKSDLNAYTKVEGQSACCSPAPQTTSSSCCSGTPRKSLTVSSCCDSTGHDAKASVHGHLSDLMTRYNVNDYAASVKVFAVKP
ncbi:MAG: arsenite methyltransferase [Tepidisphaeraceae bacterium]